MILLENSIITNHGKSCKSRDDLKLTELNVVTYASWYRVNKASGYDLLCNADKLIDQSRDT